MYTIQNSKTPNSIDLFINGIITENDGIGIVNDMRNAVASGVKEINFRINSYGGSVKAAYDIVSEMKTLDVVTNSINEGFAVSAASIILAAADNARAFDFSMAMIHDPLLGNKTLEDTKGKDKEFLQSVKDGILAIYKHRIKVPLKELSKMLTKETSLNASQQKDLGLVDEIIEKKSKPQIKDFHTVEDIYNIFVEHNKIETIDMEIENQNEETIVDTQIVETPVDTQVVDVVDPTIELKNSIEELNNEVTALKVENFILKNDLSSKTEIINKAVEKHGVTVLDTISEFIELIPVATEAIVENAVAPVDNTELVNELTNMVNEANNIIDENVIEHTPSEEELVKQANDLFDIKGDNETRLALKKSNPELYEKLVDIYTTNL